MLSELENTSEIVRVHDGGGSAIFFGAGYIEPKKLYQKFKSAKIKFFFGDFLNCHNSTTNKEKKSYIKY